VTDVRDEGETTTVEDEAGSETAAGARVGVGGRVLRVVGLVAIVAGVVLGLLGWSALGDAAADEDRTEAVEAEREEIAADLAAKERRRDRRLDRIATNQGAVRALQDDVNALSMTHSGFFDDWPEAGPILDRAVVVWDAGDLAGAVAILEAELGGSVEFFRSRLERMASADAVVAAGARRLPEPPR